MKYLGVWLDEHLNFDDQAEYAASKATRAFAKIERLIRRGEDWDHRLVLCFTNV